jgi:hypothetical protein
MTDFVNFHFDIDGDNFTSAGEASVKIKKLLRQMEFSAETIRRVSVAMYEGEINMAIHANGGTADVNVYCDRIEVILKDSGPGIPDIEKNRRYGVGQAAENGFKRIHIAFEEHIVGIDRRIVDDIRRD